jgi:hypothetical protein
VLSGAWALRPFHFHEKVALPVSAVLRFSLPVALVSALLASISGVAQESLDSTAPASALPEAPRPQPQGSLTFGERMNLERNETLGAGAFAVPAWQALCDMAQPLDRIPREWRDGGGAFARNYEANLASNTTAGVAHFAVAAIDHEDPRYYPSQSHGFAGRAMHAVAFTLVDRTTSGHAMPAVSNFVGAAAGGAVGMAFYPNGFRDATHAFERGTAQMSSFATHNLLDEFSPEIGRVLRWMHLPDAVVSKLLP